MFSVLGTSPPFLFSGRGTQCRSHPGEWVMAGSDVKPDAAVVHCEIP